MGIFNFLRNCVQCGKNGLFTKLDENGFCPECATDQSTTVKIQNGIPPELDLNNVRDRITSRVRSIGDCIQLYSYIRVPVCKVNRDTLRKMYISDSFTVIPTLEEDGSIALYSETESCIVAYLSERISMCKDWILHNNPIRCEFTGFKENSEHVVLAFYRNEEARLQNRKSIIVKLTSCFSDEKQDGIQNLFRGDKLTCSEDDDADEKVNVLDYCEEPIGRLPKKYADIFLSEGFSGVFFDHAEENDNDKLIPYVKIYL